MVRAIHRDWTLMVRAIMFHIGIATQHPPLPEPGQLSALGIDFIEQCLTLDPAQRPTADQLVHHPWLSPMIAHLVSHLSVVETTELTVI